MRKEFSDRTRALAFQRANGRCDKCGKRLQPGKIAYDHIIPDWLSSRNDISNCAVLCTPCHSEKTRGDAGLISKTKRQHARDIGAHKSRNSLPGGKTSKWKRKITGEIVLRERR